MQELYRQALGTAFHGSANALVHSKRCSLEPLREGRSCLKCDLNSRIQIAELVSLKIDLTSGNHVTLDKGDVFKGTSPGNPKAASRNTASPQKAGPSSDLTSFQPCSKFSN